MKRFARPLFTAGSLGALALAGTLIATPINAASPNVEAAIKSLGKIETDGAKFQAFCKIMKDLGDVPEADTAKAETLEAQLDNLLKSIGADVAQAWDLGADLDMQSPDGKAFEAAVDAMESKCPE